MTKKTFLFSIVIFSMTMQSCSFVQLFEVNSSNTKYSEGYFQTENDTLRIIYNFNSEGGTMSFLILNNTVIRLII